jgi:5-enolpyruvylshikimate-3-phosphate synthase
VKYCQERQHRRYQLAWQVRYPQRQARLYMGNAGTAIRPLTAALAVIGGRL